jgi:K+/H+ antiporter YhaU regulatory subunit KhtT
MILGLERDGYATNIPDANMLIEQGDILWIIGTERDLKLIAAHSMGEFGTHADDEVQAVKA